MWNKLTMESVVLGHHISKVFWTPAIGEELPPAQENAIKHNTCKYAIAVAKDGNTISMFHGRCQNYPGIS